MYIYIYIPFQEVRGNGCIIFQVWDFNFPETSGIFPETSRGAGKRTSAISFVYVRLLVIFALLLGPGDFPEYLRIVIAVTCCANGDK